MALAQITSKAPFNYQDLHLKLDFKRKFATLDSWVLIENLDLPGASYSHYIDSDILAMFWDGDGGKIKSLQCSVTGWLTSSWARFFCSLPWPLAPLLPSVGGAEYASLCK